MAKFTIDYSSVHGLFLAGWPRKGEVIEINTLEELFEFQKKLEDTWMILRPPEGDGKRVIEIYNDYRE
jgi:hypothetical protein